MVRRRAAILPFLLAGCLVAAVPRSAAAAEPSVQITGTKVLAAEFAQDAAGLPPQGAAHLERWASRATARILAAYNANGYTFARAWFDVTPDGTVRIDIDEGRMSGMVFLGVSPQQALFFRLDVVLPHDVFHLPTLQHGLNEIKTKYTMESINWAVVDREELIPNALDQPVALRALRVSISRADSHGWKIQADLDPTFGFVPSVGYRKSSLMVDRDRLEVGLAIGVPWRRYLMDTQPRFTWVYGELWGRYRMRPFAQGRLTPSFEALGTLSRYSRGDLGLDTYLAAQWATYANLSVHVVRGLLSMTFGVGLGDIEVFAVTRLPSPDPASPPPATPAPVPPPERSRLRYLFRFMADLDPDPDLPDGGRKRNLHVQAELAVPNSGDVLLALSLEGRYEFSFGYHDLLFRTRGVYLLGTVLFWDDQSLAGDCQRVFFGDRYRIREAAQLEVAARFGLWKDKIKLGVFHDLSVFRDRTRPGRPTAIANGFGPSMHFLIYDQFRLDLYYGFGWAPSGFDHNISLALQSTF